MLIEEKFMNSASSKISAKTGIKFIIREGVFFSAFFLYLWLRINPALYNQRQDPIFLLDFRFFRGFLNYPGGLLDYAAVLLSQLYYFPMLGALVITATVWAVTRLTAALIRAIRPGYQIQLVHFIPAILLLMLHSHYKHPLAVSLALGLSLLFVLLQFRIGKSAMSRIVSYLAVGLVLFYVAGGVFLLYALMCILYEAFYLRRPVLSIVYLLIALAVPYMAKEFLFLINDQMAYLHLLPFTESYTPLITPYLLILFYILVFIIYHPFIFERLGFLKKLKFRNSWLQYGLQTLVLFLVAGVAAFFSFEKNNHLLLQVDYYARHQQWEDIIRTSVEEPSNLLQVAFHTNRALFHTDQLLENMFSFPQNNSTAGLILPKGFSDSAPLQESDFCYELGSINEARHWAYEAVSTDGETPWIVKRMVIVNFVSGDFRAAERCLNVLDKMLFFKDWAREFRKILQNPALASNDEILSHGLSMLVKKDFVIMSGHPPVEFDSLLKENPKNKMAFEYRIAHELLTCRLGGLMKDLNMLNNFNYRHIPRHVEEALLSLWVISKTPETPPFIRYIRNETLQHFQDFNHVLAKYNGDRKAAQSELRQQFGNTYWYYLFYNNPIERKAGQTSSRMWGIE